MSKNWKEINLNYIYIIDNNYKIFYLLDFSKKDEYYYSELLYSSTNRNRVVEFFHNYIVYGKDAYNIELKNKDYLISY